MVANHGEARMNLTIELVHHFPSINEAMIVAKSKRDDEGITTWVVSYVRADGTKRLERKFYSAQAINIFLNRELSFAAEAAGEMPYPTAYEERHNGV